MLGPHIIQWLDDRKINVPVDHLFTTMQDGTLFLKLLHTHIEHPPEFPRTKLDRWKLIVSILLDAGIEITDVGLRMIFFGCEKTLVDVMNVFVCAVPPRGRCDHPA